MSQRSSKETNDFSQKMSHQGKAAFGAGPWNEPEKIEIGARAAISRSTPERTCSAKSPTRPDKRPPCRLGDRILTGLAIFSLGMLIVGAMGAYLSRDSQRVATSRDEPVTPAPALAATSDMQYQELKSRLAEINERYGQRLQVLETKVEQTIDPYAVRLAILEHRLDSTGNLGDNGTRESVGTQASFEASRYEARLAAIEDRLDQADAPHQANLQGMETRMEQAYAGYDARLQEMESRLMQIQIPYEQRIQTLEQQLIYASARLDYLSSEMDTLIDNNAAQMQASATLQNDPPAALPPPERTASSRVMPEPPALAEPVAMPPARLLASTAAQPATVPDEANHTTRPESDETKHEPAEGAMTEAAVSVVNQSVAASPVVPKSVAQDTAPSPAPETADELAGDTEPAGAAPNRTTAAPEADATLTSAPPAIARTGTARTPPEAAEAIANGTREHAPSLAGNGNWAINLASYASESIAARKLTDFKHKGVNAEQTVATVNGKTIYRVRVTGFETRKSALEQAKSIRAQLGLKETWITRR